jgi:hypothetical protein
MKHNTLMEAQLSAYPDSIKLTDLQMMDTLRTATPDWLSYRKLKEWRYYSDLSDALKEDEWLVNRMYETSVDLQSEEARAQWARNAFIYRAETPEGFFYACCKQPDGKYKFVGFRYGLEDSEYASGFCGMNYTPEGESK